MRKCGFVVAGALGLGLLRWSDAAACSCLGAQLEIIGPDRVDDAPLNTRVRFEAPANGAPVSAKNAVLRVSDTGVRAEITERDWKDGSTIFVELTPTKPLAASTRYEVAFIDPDPNAYPNTTVLSTFKTGNAADTTPPKLDAVGAAVAKGDARAHSSMCGIPGPWVEVSGIVASDPGRPNAKLRFGIWTGDAAGNVDTSKPPAALYAKWEATLTIGKRSLCDPHDFPIPMNAPSMTIAIAAVDEAGNMSAPRKLPKIALAGVGAHP
jgi:hypothetical protein